MISRNEHYPELNKPDWIREQYDDEIRSVRSIAREIGCSKTALLTCMDRAGIRLRPRPTYPLLDNKEWVREQYEDNRRTAQSIADEVGCDPSTVYRAMDRHEIKRDGMKKARAYWPGHE